MKHKIQYYALSWKNDEILTIKRTDRSSCSLVLRHKAVIKYVINVQYVEI